MSSSSVFYLEIAELKRKIKMGVISNPFKNQSYTHFIKKLLPWTLYAILPIALFRLCFHPIHLPDSPFHPLPKITISSPSSSSSLQKERVNANEIETPCDYTDGKWVPSKLKPLYNDSSCSTIKEGQNCISHGRSDLGYLNYRWQPKKCNLSRFNPDKFFLLLRNKHLAFVGDSMARNQLESLLCMLSSSSIPNLVFHEEENKFRKWHFPSNNLTVSVYWSPFLVDGLEKSNIRIYNELYLNRVNEKWAADLGQIHVIVFSFGHWFLHPAVYFEHDSVLGCHYCPDLNHTEIGFYDVLRKALKTTFRTIIERRNGMKVFLTTFSPAHFEGEWDKAGACPKTKPFEENEKKLEGMNEEIRSIEIEEVEEAKLKAKEIVGLRIEALDVTKLSLMRGDGHPGPYMHRFPYPNGVKETDRVQNDCVHWCLPGPVDTWNEILLQMMNRLEHQSRGGQ